MSTFDPNDPRLTDYVLGELDEAQRAEVERLLDRSPAARTAVDELLEVSGLLTESFKAVPAPKLTDDQRAAIDAAVMDAAKAVPVAKSRRRSLVRAVATLATVAASIAALFFVVMRLNGSASTGVARNGVRSMILGEAGDAKGDETDANKSLRTRSETRLTSATTGIDESFNQQDGLTRDQGQESLARREKRIISEDNLSTSDFSAAKPQSGNASAPAQTLPQLDSWPKHGTVVGASDPSVFVDEAETVGPTTEASPGQESVPQSRSGASTVVFSKDGKTIILGAKGQPSAGEGQVARHGEGVLEDGRKAAGPVIHEVLDGTSNTISLGESSAPSAPLAEGVVTTPLPPGPTPVSADSRQLIAATEKSPQQQRAYRYFGFGRSDDRPDRGASAGKEDTKSAEAYDAIVENPFFSPGGAPLSTFSIDVDTASYSNMRRFLASGQQPPRDSVRIEELVNYFDYEDPAPTDGRPFAVRLEAASCPWAADHRLVRVSLKGKEIAKSERPPTNLVFLLDVSGSMRDANKLPLAKEAMKLLVGEMTEDDRIAIVTYAGNAGLKLDSTTGDKKDVIIKAIDSLQAGGSTNGEAGIQLAYSTAVAHLLPEGSNRVILCTDGDFNVGVSGDDELVGIIQDKARDSKVFLSVFGFGMGNLKDAKLEKLADKGNGHYAYVDNLREAKKVFVEGLTGTLYTIAKDVKLQVEFNPAKVGAYRLIGYENRVMPAEHFNDDTKDAGEIGAGHTVTALYELVPADKMTAVAKRPDLRYQEQTQSKEEPKPQLKHGDELLTVSLRYKHPDRNTSEKLEFPLVDAPGQASQGSRDMQWTTAVAAFGMLLRGSQYRGQASFDMVLELAQAGRGEDKSGRRAEFIELAKTAKALYGPQSAVPPSTQAADPKSPQ